MKIRRICTSVIALAVTSYAMVDMADAAPRKKQLEKPIYSIGSPNPLSYGYRGAGIIACDAGTTLVSENVDMFTVITGNSINCFAGNDTPGHSYGRSHDLSAGLTSGTPLEITCIHFGLAQNTLAGTATVKIYIDLDAIAGPSSDESDLLLISSIDMGLPATMTPIILTATPASPIAIAADSLIFVEIVIPESSPGSHEIGSNDSGEYTTSWLKTTNGDCGIGTWTNPSVLGAPDMHILEAIEVVQATISNPCNDLLSECVEDINNDNFVDVTDLLDLISNWGTCGDGTFRPYADIAPMPSGDCCVDVVDLLALIGAWGMECDTGGGGGISINEIRAKEPGDDDDEYFELKGEVGASLDGLTYVVIGDNTAGGDGVVEEAVLLDGYSIGGQGLFVCGEANMTITVPDLYYELNFENNGNKTHMLVSGFTGMKDDDLDVDDDGILDVLPWNEVLDSVAIIGPDPVVDGHFYSGTTVGPDSFYTPGHVYYCIEGEGQWYVGAFELSVLDTPGLDNNCNTGDQDGDGTIDLIDNCYLFNPDQSDCDFDGIGDVCEFADGTATDCNMNNIPDNCEDDCNLNGSPDDCDINDEISSDCNANSIPDECETDCNGNETPDDCDIADGFSTDTNGNGVPDECEGSAFVINEINADPSNAPDGTYGDGDANGDGVGHYSDDEFVEIVNLSGADIDMSEWTLSDGANGGTIRHIFPVGTVLSNGCAVVVFGGGTPIGNFGGAIVMVSSGGSLGLNNSGDSVTIADADGILRLFVEYGSSAGDNQSITLSPDVYGDTYVKHSDVSPTGALFSPGTDVHGLGFGGDCGSTLPDTDGDGIPDKYDNCDLPNTDQADCDGNGIGDVCDIADGTLVDVDGNGIPDVCEETTDGAWINEFHYDNASSDMNEFIEVVVLNGIDPNTVTLSIYNGSNGEVINGGSYNVGSDMIMGEVGSTFTIYSVLHAGIQNSLEGVALDIGGAISHFISYEGTFTASEGPASGMTSQDIGVTEGVGTSEFSSLGLSGSGLDPSAMTWTVFTDLATMGTLNDGQVIDP